MTGWRLPPGWPLYGLLLGYPLWWALGLGVLIFPIAAVPMAVILVRRHLAGRPLRVPPGFLLWLLFLAVVLLGLATLAEHPAGTMTESATDRLPGAGFRVVGYASLTVLLLYAGNTPEIPRRRLVAMLAWLLAVTVAGGLLGTVAGALSFTSPVELLLPPELRGNGFVRSLVHPQAAQVMDVGTGEVARPAAPWGYTNTWGHSLLLLIGWYLVWAAGVRRGPVRLLAAALLGLAVVPVVQSLNRGLWIGLAVLAVIVLIERVRVGARRGAGPGWEAGRDVPCARHDAGGAPGGVAGARPEGRSGGRLTLLAAGLAVVTAVVMAAGTPVGETVRHRLTAGHSDGVRTYLAQQAVSGVTESPAVGFGSTRSTQGGRNSIAIGPTADCERCGAFTVGGNGQLWQLLFAHGLLGTGAYLAFFGYGWWRFRRDGSPVGIAGRAAIASSFVSMWWYNALVAPLALLMLGYALLWRSGVER